MFSFKNSRKKSTTLRKSANKKVQLQEIVLIKKIQLQKIALKQRMIKIN